ncbi:MAG TPA: hypothetical protein PKK43_09835, partial [Spirochaetota bacterium]|nr:hypothetical protein [Spirochaetota bacterium]
SDNTIDEIIEYYPETATFGYPVKPSTKLFSDYPKIKKDIIEGTVFKDSSRVIGTEYTHEMASLPVLLQRIREGRYVSKRGTNGIYVRNMDSDQRSSIMSDFYFARVQGEYFLQFRTNYYKSGNLRAEPLIQYSVYCKESSDPVVKEYVEMLLKKAREKRTE